MAKLATHEVKVDGELLERDGVKYLLVDRIADDKGGIAVMIAALRAMADDLDSPDADSVVAPDWIARQLEAIAAGAEAIGGEVHLDPAEAAALPDGATCAAITSTSSWAVTVVRSNSSSTESGVAAAAMTPTTTPPCGRPSPAPTTPTS